MQQSGKKPFLRWAGGKNWLTKNFTNLLPAKGFNNYHEPFLGGGAVFFHLCPKSHSYLSDLNKDLVETFCQVKINVDSVIRNLKSFTNDKDFYYYVRDVKIFRSPASKAARFIYLNQTSFNGIYRENLKGKYNVPYGFRDKNFLDADVLRSASDVLKRSSISTGDFYKNISKVKKNDLVFLDPPYTITHNDNGFFKYNQHLFTKADQLRLAEYIDQIKTIGAYYILTNAAHKDVKKIFSNGDSIIELDRASLVGGKNAKRGKFSEIIVSNTARN